MEELRFAAVDALPLIALSHLIDLLVPYLADPYANLRWVLCELLHGYQDERVVLPLVRVLLEDPEPDVRLVAAEALVSVGDARALPALEHVAWHDSGKDYEDRSIADTAREAIAAIRVRQQAIFDKV